MKQKCVLLIVSLMLLFTSCQSYSSIPTNEVSQTDTVSSPMPTLIPSTPTIPPTPTPVPIRWEKIEPGVQMDYSDWGFEGGPDVAKVRSWLFMTVNLCPNGCSEPKPGCDIKGNISIKNGNKIYHMPGQEYYLSTIISPENGERWFCSEEDAKANGWRKSYR